MSTVKNNNVIVRTDKTLNEYRKRFGHLYDKGKILSYTKAEYETYFNKPHFAPARHYRSKRIKEYWLINNLYYEVPERTVKASKKPVAFKAKDIFKAKSEKTKIAIDMMHYKSNRISFWLILLTIALNIAMFIIIYRANTSDVAADLQLGFDLIINVLFMLVAFLAAEKTKRYSREWGIVSIVLGGIQVARIFWIPLYYFLNGGITSGLFAACVILLAGSAASVIIAGIFAIIKYRILQENEPLIKKEGAKKDVRT